MSATEAPPQDAISLAAAAKQVRVDGRPVSPVSLWRWHRHGKHGVHLKAWPRGRHLVTTSEAVRDFERQVAEADRRRWDARNSDEIISITNRDVEAACEAEGI